MMDMGMAVALPLAGLIGLGLGLLGGGGSVLMVPLLVYGMSLKAADAVATSLGLVGVISLVGAILHARKGRIDYKAALSFGAAGMVGAMGGARLTQSFNGAQLLSLLGGVMVLVAILMFLRRELQPGDCDQHAGKTLLAGFLVGGMTGFIGVGGGFMIVPALGLFACMPLQKAVGSSLLVTAMNSTAGFLGHWGAAALPLEIMAGFVIAGVIGVVIGAHLLGRVPVPLLCKTFASVVLVVALSLLWQNTFWR